MPLFFMVAVIGGECVAAYLLTSAYRPSGAAIAAGPLKEAAGKGKPAKETEDSAEKSQTEELEVDLGKFDVNSYQPKANTTSIIDFHLYATIASSDKSAFNASIEQNKNRLRDQILVIVRSADLAELTEPGLGLLKRRILRKVTPSSVRLICERSFSATSPSPNSSGPADPAGNGLPWPMTTS